MTICRLRPLACSILVFCVPAICGCSGQKTASSKAPAPAPQTAAPALSAQDVRAALVQAVRDAPKDPLPRLELALFDLRTNDPHDAESELLSLCSQFPGFPRGPYYLGLLYLTHGFEAKALPPLRAAVVLARDDAQAHLNLAIASLRLGLEAEAKRSAETAIKLDPQSPDAYLIMARANDHHGTALQAIKFAKQYIERSPIPGPGYNLIGRIYASQANKEEAERWYKLAIDADPKAADSWLALGRVYYELFGAPRAEDGVRCVQKAIELNPDQWEAHQSLGRVMRDRQQWPEAVAQFEAALRSSPSPSLVQYDLAQALIKAGRQEEGQKMLDAFQAREKAKREYTAGFEKLSRAISAAPKDKSKRVELARFCLLYRQNQQAESVIRETMEKFGQDPVLTDLLVLSQAGRSGGPPNAGQPPVNRSGSSGIGPAPMPPGRGASGLPQGGSEIGR